MDELATRYARQRVIVDLNMFRGVPSGDAVRESALYEFCPFDNQLDCPRCNRDDALQMLRRDDNAADTSRFSISRG